MRIRNSHRRTYRRIEGTDAIVAALLFSLPLSAAAYDINDRLSVGGVLAGAGQYQIVSEDDGADDELRGALVFQPELSFRPTSVDEFFVKLGFAEGNGLNKVSPFRLSPWVADLEDDVKDINGRKRDYLFTAWYKRSFNLWQGNVLGVSAGLIDANDYLDGNVYANDEYTQFMNEAFFGRRLFPAYDIGGALELDIGSLGLRGVAMQVGENEEGRDFGFVGVQLSLKTNSRLGAGNYRLIFNQTTEDFDDPAGERQERLIGIGLSIDQQFGDILGGFLKVGGQGDKAAVSYELLLSAGIDISGKVWGRAQDNMGIGYAYLDGGNLDIDRTQVVEVYARFALNDYFALTLDLQYLDDDLVGGGGPEGFVPGLRVASIF